MSGCEGVRELAQAYLDGELAPQERERLEMHVHACPSCRQALEGYRQLFACLEEPAIPEPSSGFAARTLARVAAAGRRRRAAQALAIAAGLFAAAAAAILLTWGGIPEAVGGLGEALAPDAWFGAIGAAAELAMGLVAAGGEWHAELPGGAVAVVVLVVAVVAEVVLARRWRGLASVQAGTASGGLR